MSFLGLSLFQMLTLQDNETDKVLIGSHDQKLKFWYIDQISIIRHWLELYKNVVEFVHKIWKNFFYEFVLVCFIAQPLASGNLNKMKQKKDIGSNLPIKSWSIYECEI